MQRRAPGALRESSSPVPGDQSGRPGDGRLPFGAVRRAMPAVLASVQKRRWRRALPAVTQTYTESCRPGQDNFILGLFESGSVECRAGARQRAERPLRCAETPASGSGGVARRGCSAGGVRHPYTRAAHNHRLARRAPSSRRCSRGWTWRRRRSPGTALRPASAPDTARTGSDGRRPPGPPNC